MPDVWNISDRDVSDGGKISQLPAGIGQGCSSTDSLAGKLAVESSVHLIHLHVPIYAKFFSSPEQHSGRAVVLPPALALALASASTNVKVFVKVFKTSLFPNLITDLIHLWYDDTYWSKILRSVIPTTLGHVKVKVTDLEFSC